MSSKDISPRLFLDDEFEETKIVPDKVVCLGMEFPSEDARREYFRAELRKKLPELKQIEGFPIGEDDDIINLSLTLKRALHHSRDECTLSFFQILGKGKS